MAGSGWGQECGPALRPRSWPRPSRGPGALSAAPPSRRLLARVTPAAPRTRGWTRAERGAFLLGSRVRDPRPAWGRAQGSGAEAASGLRVPTPSFPPRRRSFPDSRVSPLRLHRRRAPPRAGLRAVVGAVTPLCGLGNGLGGAACVSVGARHLHGSRSRGHGRVPAPPGIVGPSGRDTLHASPRSSRVEVVLRGPQGVTRDGTAPGSRPAPCSLPLAGGAGSCPVFAQVRARVSTATRGSCTRNCALSAEPASGQGFSQAGDTCGCTAGTRVGQTGLPGHPPPCAGPGLDECRAALCGGHLPCAAPNGRPQARVPLASGSRGHCVPAGLALTRLSGRAPLTSTHLVCSATVCEPHSRAGRAQRHACGDPAVGPPARSPSRAACTFVAS